MFARDAHTLMLAKREGMVDDQFTYDRVFGQRAPQAEVRPGAPRREGRVDTTGNPLIPDLLETL